ncbi:MAG: hypothetical protein P9L90_05295 [Candidatus Aadella gelida]|nr:hypothetical protein [Candidatus Aadella gelida]
MKLKKQTTEELKKIIKNDYGVLLNDDEATELGSSLLKLTRLALTALARADEKKRLVSSGKSESHS